jgi:hypothetical protein
LTLIEVKRHLSDTEQKVLREAIAQNRFTNSSNVAAGIFNHKREGNLPEELVWENRTVDQAKPVHHIGIKKPQPPNGNEDDRKGETLF